MAMNLAQAVYCDVDGTLVDGAMDRHFRSIAAEHGFAEALAWYKASLRADLPVNAGLVEALEGCRRLGQRLVLWTNRGPEAVEATRENLGDVWGLFDDHLFGDGKKRDLLPNSEDIIVVDDDEANLLARRNVHVADWTRPLIIQGTESSGLYSTVYRVLGRNDVVVKTTLDEAWLAYVDNFRGADFCPVTRKLGVFDGLEFVEVEALDEAEADLQQQYGDDVKAALVWYGAWKRAGRVMREQLEDEGEPWSLVFGDLVNLAKVADFLGFAVDTNPANTMVRPDGTALIIDPWMKK